MDTDPAPCPRVPLCAMCVGRPRRKARGGSVEGVDDRPDVGRMSDHRVQLLVGWLAGWLDRSSKKSVHAYNIVTKILIDTNPSRQTRNKQKFGAQLNSRGTRVKRGGPSTRARKKIWQRVREE